MNKEVLQKTARVLKKDLRKLGKHGSRIHIDTAENNVNRLRAIEGICGSCNNISIEIFTKDYAERARLRCREGLSPLDLYRKTDIGQEAICENFSAKE